MVCSSSRRGGAAVDEWSDGTTMNGHVSECTIQGLTVVRLAGDQDVATASSLRGRLVSSRRATRPDLVVDLRAVEFIDCAVLGAMVGARTVALGAGGCVRLVGLQPLPERVFSLCDLLDLFCVYDSFDEAAGVCQRHDSWEGSAAR